MALLINTVAEKYKTSMLADLSSVLGISLLRRINASVEENFVSRRREIRQRRKEIIQ